MRENQSIFCLFKRQALFDLGLGLWQIMLLFVHKSQIVESQSKCCISPIIFKEVTKEVFVESPESAKVIRITLCLRQQQPLP